MAGKRKRKRHCQSAEDRPKKRVRVGNVVDSAPLDCTAITHPVLSLYYPAVVTLRRYLWSKFPISSKARRRRLLATGCCAEQSRSGLRRSHPTHVDELNDSSRDDSHGALASLLDTTLVCGLEISCSAQDQSRINELATFSQHQSRSTAGSSPGSGNCSQSEVRSILSDNVEIPVRCHLVSLTF